MPVQTSIVDHFVLGVTPDWHLAARGRLKRAGSLVHAQTYGPLKRAA